MESRQISIGSTNAQILCGRMSYNPRYNLPYGFVQIEGQHLVFASDELHALGLRALGMSCADIGMNLNTSRSSAKHLTFQALRRNAQFHGDMKRQTLIHQAQSLYLFDQKFLQQMDNHITYLWNYIYQDNTQAPHIAVKSIVMNRHGISPVYSVLGIDVTYKELQILTMLQQNISYSEIAKNLNLHNGGTAQDCIDVFYNRYVKQYINVERRGISTQIPQNLLVPAILQRIAHMQWTIETSTFPPSYSIMGVNRDRGVAQTPQMFPSENKLAS
ncbi:MAG: hypothetical protein WCO06_06345 [Candidatus Roizmanbacteria bacterium]